MGWHKDSEHSLSIIFGILSIPIALPVTSFAKALKTSETDIDSPSNSGLSAVESSIEAAGKSGSSLVSLLKTEWKNELKMEALPDEVDSTSESWYIVVGRDECFMKDLM